jgi:hypothetical protein
LPVLPNGLKGTEARANYLALHYWDNYDFSNILMLEKILLQPSLSEKHRQEFGFDLKMAKKNCLGSVATDFCFITRSGKRSSLLETHCEYILLFWEILIVMPVLGQRMNCWLRLISCAMWIVGG